MTSEGGALNASMSGCTRDMDPIGAEILLFGKPEHPLPQAKPAGKHGKTTAEHIQQQNFYF